MIAAMGRRLSGEVQCLIRSTRLAVRPCTAVYSPRRFPGMLEPTELSKKLASQGED